MRKVNNDIQSTVKESQINLLKFRCKLNEETCMKKAKNGSTLKICVVADLQEIPIGAVPAWPSL
jgi:hypothetical protein